MISLITGHLVIEQFSKRIYWNPLPRNSVLAQSSVLDIFENARHKGIYQSFSRGKTGNELVDFTWRKGHIENHGSQTKTIQRVNDFNKDENGISYSTTCAKRNPNQIDALVL